jgi:hypothetical protein
MDAPIPTAFTPATCVPDETIPGAGTSSQDLALLFTRTADVLDRSAALAEDHAAACERAGQDVAAAKERGAARRARQGARRARSRADDFHARCVEGLGAERSGQGRVKRPQPEAGSQ